MKEIDADTKRELQGLARDLVDILWRHEATKAQFKINPPCSSSEWVVKVEKLSDSDKIE